MDVTPEQIAAFKAAWHKADDEGRDGERVRDGLAAVLAPLQDRLDPAQSGDGAGRLPPRPPSVEHPTLM